MTVYLVDYFDDDGFVVHHEFEREDDAIQLIDTLKEEGINPEVYVGDGIVYKEKEHGF